MSSSEMGTFMNNPGQDMNRFPNGGQDLTKRVADLVKTDKAALAKLIEFAKTANEDQRKAIARGLADAAKAYAAGDPAFANQIQQSVANSGLPEFAKAYAEAAGDTGTAATGGGGGGGGPIAGGPTGGPNNGTLPTTNGVNTQTTGLSNSSVGGSSFSNTTTTTTNTQSSPF